MKEQVLGTVLKHRWINGSTAHELIIASPLRCGERPSSAIIRAGKQRPSDVVRRPKALITFADVRKYSTNGCTMQDFSAQTTGANLPSITRRESRLGNAPEQVTQRLRHFGFGMENHQPFVAAIHPDRGAVVHAREILSPRVCHHGKRSKPTEPTVAQYFALRSRKQRRVVFRLCLAVTSPLNRARTVM